MKKYFFVICLIINYNVFSQVMSDTIDNILGATSNINGIYVVPDGVDKIKVQCWGGGGSGGAATGQAAAGGGGSGGSYVEIELAVTPGQSFNYSIGNGGNGQTISSNRHGGDTWFNTSTFLLAKGGTGGTSSILNFNTSSGAPSINSGNIGGQISYYGGAGGTGTYGANGSQAGGGGGSAGINANGNPGLAATGGTSGLSGGNGASAGTWQLPLNCNCNGNDGATPGGGGSGGQSSDPADNHGGHGGPGRIIITETNPGIGGFIYKDLNGNCFNNLEDGLQGVQVIVAPGDYITETDDQGYWAINDLPVGVYTIEIDTTKYPMIICDTVSSVTVVATDQFYDVGDVGIYNISCPILDVSILTPTLRRCFSQMVYVTACNHFPSTTTVFNSYIEVELNPFLSITSASLPYTSLGNDVYQFQTGDIAPGQCVNINIMTYLSCAATLGQTLCMNAELFPVENCALDTLPSGPNWDNIPSEGALGGLPQPCLGPWDQSSLSVDGWCQNDSIYFTITNTGVLGGGDMECYAPVWLTVNGVVTFTDSIMLQGGQTITYAFEGNGQTWILNASQHPLHPGNSQPNAFVERCGNAANWNPGEVNDYPQDDADPVIDIYCEEVSGSYDPNDKRGYPNGVTNMNYIQPNQQLQYVIRFQNTGTDTAFTVVIRDTLDTDLNIFTVTPGVSSHSYEFRMYGPRVLEWRFDNILLPDSTTNSAGSNGFVTFHVEQNPNLAPGTVINNDADIYFDYNDPITTNTTVHRIYEGFPNVLSLQDLVNSKESMVLFPNPTSSEITINSDKFTNEPYTLYDQMGRIVGSGTLAGTSTTLSLSTLSKGIYILKVEGAYESAIVVKE